MTLRVPAPRGYPSWPLQGRLVRTTRGGRSWQPVAGLTIPSLYVYSTHMKRKLVQAGGSLAVTLPSEVVQEFELKKGMTVEVSVHPQTGAVTIRPGVRFFEGGKTTKRFDRLADDLLERRKKAYRELAK